MLVQLIKVLKKPGNIFLSIISAMIILALTIWLPNYKLISSFITSDLSLLQKTNLLISLLGGFKTNFTLFSRLLLTFTSILFGVNLSLLKHYYQKFIIINRPANLSLGGLLASFLGIGCTSCGSVILSSIFGLGAATGFIGLLPFRGLEFNLLSLILITASTILLLKKLAQSTNCQLK